MKAIVAVYHSEDNMPWGIGKNGTQPITLNADRKFFRRITNKKTVIVGYKTLLDFPNSSPLPGRLNIVLTSKNLNIPGAIIVNSIDDLDINKLSDAFVIGGASIYNQMLKYCNEVFVTHIYTDINPDVFFPVLNEDEWSSEIIENGEENNIQYKIVHYHRQHTK